MSTPSAGLATPEFVIELDRFQGPLDLLLHLVREQDIDIFDIPIARITEQFLDAIQEVETLGLDRAGEFLEMAATLVRLKAQMLLPRRTDELAEGEDPRSELVRRLLEYEHFREVARQLAAAEAARARHYRRGYILDPPAARGPSEPLQLDWSDLWGAAVALDRRLLAPPEHRVAARIVSIERQMDLIRQALAAASRVEFSRLIRAGMSRVHIVVTFLAGLELARRRVLALRQREPFGPLWLYRRSSAGDGSHPDR